MVTKQKSVQPTPEKPRNPFGNSSSQHIAPSFAELTHLGAVLDAVCRAGCAIMFGHTRDGGAVVTTVLDGDNRYKQFCGNDGELERTIDSIFAAYEDL